MSNLLSQEGLTALLTLAGELLPTDTNAVIPSPASSRPFPTQAGAIERELHAACVLTREVWGLLQDVQTRQQAQEAQESEARSAGEGSEAQQEDEGEGEGEQERIAQLSTLLACAYYAQERYTQQRQQAQEAQRWHGRQPWQPQEAQEAQEGEQ